MQTFIHFLAVTQAKRPSTIRVRIEGLRAPAVVQLITQVLTTFGEELKDGAVVSVKPRKTTCHPLPIGNSPLAR